MALTDGADRKASGQQQEEEIPAFQTIAPCIFVPAQEDFTKPPPPLPSDPDTLRSEALARIDEHADRVQDNIYYMLNREKTRIRQESYWREAQFPQLPRGVSGLAEGEDSFLPSNAKELDEILHIRSRCSEPPRGPYEVPPNFSHLQCLHVESGLPGEPPRKSAEKMLLNVVKHGVQNLEGLAAHVAREKAMKISELESEMRSKVPASTRSPHADKMDTSED
ncbi:hypothetical protein GGS26DRAFT_201053 [Hypomontagnella submonticulosa]|nr:hypothetical protein GGS26DRAFT_201053 [Hypomontagnella submonticulosa]